VPARAADVLFVQTNAPNGANAVRVITSRSDGKLRSAGSFRTGQSGTGHAIHSQGTLVTTQDGHHVLALDVGSSTITVFRVGNGKLTRTDRGGSGGRRPISIASAGNRVFVLNAGSGPNLSVFDVQGTSGRLTPVLSVPLAQGNARPYAVATSPSGHRAAVSYEKGTGGRDVEVFEFAGNQLTGSSLVAVSGGGPGALAFSGEDQLLVGRMAHPGPGLANYAIGPGATTLSLVGQMAEDSCWIENGDNLGWATFPSSVTAFARGSGGSLSSVKSRHLSGRTSDLAIGTSQKRLYVLNERHAKVRVLALDPRTLSVLGASPLLPKTTTGLVDLPNSIGGFSTKTANSHPLRGSAR
jgi:6-phosphogluconolactonase (cycloisomerase 2 family)